MDRPLFVTLDGHHDPSHAWDAAHPTALLPGAFNPVHAAHWGLADVASQILGLPVAFELSVANVDKPDIDSAEVRARLAQFAGRAPVWLTRAPRFVEKAERFPGATFVVGADTAVRMVSARYYEQDPARLAAALARLRAQDCRFLVACRTDAAGQCLELDDVPVPAEFRDLFTGIPARQFRLDISSTELRGKRP